MSNRFAYCETTWAVLGDFRRLDVVDANDQDDALARIRELTPPLAVSEEARERVAETVLRKDILFAIEAGTDPLSRRKTIDRIIAALGYQPTEPKLPMVSEEARERAAEELSYQLQKLGLYPTEEWFQDLIDRIIDALGYQPTEPREWSVLECLGCGDQISAERYGDHRAKCPRSAEAPASPPVVELDATAVRRFIDGAQTLIGGLNSRITMIRDGQEWSLYSDGVDFVLRIGGTDE